MGLVADRVGKFIGDPPTRVLTDISLEIREKEFVALTGRSGSGKSTLLYLLSSLDSPTEGAVLIDGQDPARMPSEDLYRFRNLHMGFVFQFHYLIAELTALENILMPARKFEKENERRDRARELMAHFGLEHKEDRFPRQLSGGEQQRIAIARALVMEPRYLFADEPTGSLDTANADVVMKILRQANAERGTTVVMVTHDPGFADSADRKIQLVDGKVAAAESAP